MTLVEKMDVKMILSVLESKNKLELNPFIDIPTSSIVKALAVIRANHKAII